MTDRIEQTAECLVQGRVRLPLRQRGRRKRAGPPDRRGRKRLAEPGPPALDQLEPGERQLAVGTGAELEFDSVAGDHDGTKPPPATAGDVARDDAVRFGEDSRDDRGFTVRPGGEEDGRRAQVHRDGLGISRKDAKTANLTPAKAGASFDKVVN